MDIIALCFILICSEVYFTMICCLGFATSISVVPYMKYLSRLAGCEIVVHDYLLLPIAITIYINAIIKLSIQRTKLDLLFFEQLFYSWAGHSRSLVKPYQKSQARLSTYILKIKALDIYL